MPPDVVDRQRVEDFETLIAWMDAHLAQQCEGGEQS